MAIGISLSSVLLTPLFSRTKPQIFCLRDCDASLILLEVYPRCATRQIQPQLLLSQLQ